jgi:protoporphyrinogen oxidase
MVKYLILGAGPAGLTFANMLKQNGEDSFLVLEKENEAGGLCRSVELADGFIDIGGGHFLDTRREEVLNFVFKFMPQHEWNRFKRNSQIDINGKMINSPIEANIWQFDIVDQVEYLKSIARAGCNLGQPMPTSFIEWIYWKLGDKIAKDYMIPYNTKMFSDSLDELGTYWLEKLPDVSFEETLISCLERKAYGKQPGHAEFLYPKSFGYGELWKRMATNISEHILYGVEIEKIDFDKKIVNDVYQAEKIITTIPWTDFIELTGMPIQMKKEIKLLKFTSVQIEYFRDKMDTDAQWIYYPELNLDYHRVLVRHNFTEYNNGYWTETNCDRIKNTTNNFSYVNKHAYPMNTINKREIMKNVLDWSSTKNIYGLGRWGEWEHYNSDVTVEKALNLYKELVDM